MIVHGIPGRYVLEEGDILSIDCGAIIEGYHGDAAFTMGIGEVTDEAKRLIEVTERRLYAGIDQMTVGQPTPRDRPGGAEGGRGGRLLGRARVRRPRHRHRHARAAPGAQLLARHTGPTLKSGMVFAIEPMVNVGRPDTRLLDDRWSVVTADGRSRRTSSTRSS